MNIVDQIVECLNQKASQSGFGRLVGVSQQAISNQVHAGVLQDGGTYGEWLVQYCERLRTEAAGRSGDTDKRLTDSRIEESQIKTAQLRLTYNRDIGKAIYTEDAASVISDWARYANREYTQTTHRLVAEIQSANEITIDQVLVDSLVSPSVERIANYAAELARRLVDGIEPVHEAEGRAHGGMAG